MKCRAWTFMFVAFAVAVGCSGEDDAGSNPNKVDAGVDTGTEDVALPEGSVDAPASTFGVPFCTELGPENVQPHDTTIVNDFALKVINDCRVIQLLLPLTQAEAGAWLETTSAWTRSFFGCPGTDGSVTSFGPVDTGKGPVMSQADIDVLVEHFAVSTEQSLTLTSAQSAALRTELAKVAALSVNAPIAEHALSLCTDGGAPDSGSDASDAGVDDAASDAVADAGEQPDADPPDADPADAGID